MCYMFGGQHYVVAHWLEMAAAHQYVHRGVAADCPHRTPHNCSEIAPNCSQIAPQFITASVLV